MIANQAPILEAFFQNKPKVKGAKMQTRIRLKEATSSPTILEFVKAKYTEATAIITTLNRIQSSNDLSVILGEKGLIKFSPMIVAGANIAPLEVLRIDDIKAP